MPGNLNRRQFLQTALNGSVVAWGTVCNSIADDQMASTIEPTPPLPVIDALLPGSDPLLPGSSSPLEAEQRTSLGLRIQQTPITDTHLHLWNLRKFHLPWLHGAPQTINRSFEMSDFQAAVELLPVERAVYMEVNVHATQHAEEAAYAAELCASRQTPLTGAIIGGDVENPAFAEYVKRFAPIPWIKGMRKVLTSSDLPRGYCLRPGFRDAMRRIGDVNWSFDLCLRPDELIDGAKLVAAVPHTQFIVDHCGNIGARLPNSRTHSAWREGIRALGDLPNVSCKISGIVDKAGSSQWQPAAFAANINECLNAFGDDRVMFGGDWPVCLLGSTYQRWVEAVHILVADRSLAFRKKLFAGNADRIYRLG